MLKLESVAQADARWAGTICGEMHSAAGETPASRFQTVDLQEKRVIRHGHREACRTRRTLRERSTSFAPTGAIVPDKTQTGTIPGGRARYPGPLWIPRTLPAEIHLYAKGDHAFNMGQRTRLMASRTGRSGWQGQTQSWQHPGERLDYRVESLSARIADTPMKAGYSAVMTKVGTCAR